MDDPGLLLFTVSFTLSIYWTVFFMIRMMWYQSIEWTLRGGRPLPGTDTKLAPGDPEAPFLLAYLRDGTQGAADLAVYSLLRRDVVRFVGGTLQVLQPGAVMPTRWERCALQWAIAANNTRPSEHTYVQHAAFEPMKTLETMVRERGLAGDVGVPVSLKAWTHAIAALALVVGVYLAMHLDRSGASNTVVFISIASGVVQYLWFRLDERKKTPQLPLVLPYMETQHGGRMARMLAAQAMPLQDVLWAGGLHGVPSVWLARIEARGRDGRLTTTAAPAGWFGHSAAQEAPRPIVDGSSSSAGDHGAAMS